MDSWTHAANARAWIIHHTGDDQHQKTLRLMKIGEELGEAIEAHLGVLGQNPRKGHSHTTMDVARELCDVIISTQVALYDIVDIPAELFEMYIAQRSERLAVRVLDDNTRPPQAR